MTKTFVLAPNESWIVDRFVDEWYEHNADISTRDPHEASVIWALADWCLLSTFSRTFLFDKKVLTTVHHITPEKFGLDAQRMWITRDEITTAYHVYNMHTFKFIEQLTSKPIHFIPYWANQLIWRPTGTREELRLKHNLPIDKYLVGSFQRDTEGAGIPLNVFEPKLEKGPDILCDLLKKLKTCGCNLHVVLAGWRRQYVIKRLQDVGISYTYFELPSQEVINELYQTLDLYPVTARHEGGPQSLIECGLLGVPVVSRPIGIAEQVLPSVSIREDVFEAEAHVPNVDCMMIPNGFKPYRRLLKAIEQQNECH